MIDRTTRGRCRTITAAASVALACSGTYGQVVEWDFIKFFEYRQVANDQQPLAFDRVVADSGIVTTNPGDATAASITNPASTRAYSPDPSGTDLTMLESFGSLAAMSAVFAPSQPYQISITAGGLAGQMQSFMLGANDFPTGVPYLTGGSFNDLSATNPTSPIPLTWPTPSSAGAAFVVLSVFEILPGGADALVFESIGDPASAGATIPAGTLTPGAQYELELLYTNPTFLNPDPTGFNADGVVSFERITLVSFTALPAPGAGGLILLASLAAASRRRRPR